jgi:hypothetical protein
MGNWPSERVGPGPHETSFCYFGARFIHSKNRNRCSCTNRHFVILELDSFIRKNETDVRVRTGSSLFCNSIRSCEKTKPMFVYEQAFRYFGDRFTEKNETHVRVRTAISLFWSSIHSFEKTKPMFVYEQAFRYFGARFIHSKKRNRCSCTNRHFVILEFDSFIRKNETHVRVRTGISLFCNSIHSCGKTKPMFVYEQAFRYFGARFIHVKKTKPMFVYEQPFRYFGGRSD